LVREENCPGILDSGWVIEETGVCGAVIGESHGEHLVLSAGGEGWYVKSTRHWVWEGLRDAVRWSLGSVRLLIENNTELSLTVPITNSLAFLFTVLGEWFAEGKVISRGAFRWILRICIYADLMMQIRG
jgi:hypothetical protein